MAASYFDDLLPEAPSTKPVAPASGARPRSSAPAMGRAEEAKVEQGQEREGGGGGERSGRGGGGTGEV